MDDAVSGLSGAGTLGSRIAAARRRGGLSQHKLAVRVEVDTRTITRWESDVTVPPLLHAFRLAEVLGVTVSWLVLGDERCAEAA